MERFRKYGYSPFNVVVVHGGPGGGGEMAPVAKVLASDCGVLEPFQMADSVEGQVQELHTVLHQHADFPVVLIGFSWGAMLSFIFSARHPFCVKKLILISSGVYEEQYSSEIMKTRLKGTSINCPFITILCCFLFSNAHLLHINSAFRKSRASS